MRYAVILPALAWVGAAWAQTPRYDFETGDLQGWKVVEGKFDRLVCDRATFRNTGGIYNKHGKYYLSTVETAGYTGNDAMTGTVQSPTFTLTSAYVCFLVGGGKGPGVYVALCTAEGDAEVRVARGMNDETMLRHIWDVREFTGQQVYLKIVDHETGGWGHVTFDDFREPTPEELATIPADAAVPTPTGGDLRELCGARLRSVRAAVEDLRDSFGADYPGAAGSLARLTDLVQRLQAADKPRLKQKLTQLSADLDALAREALGANPLLTRHPILYVSRNQYKRDHHNTETMFTNGQVSGGFEGGGALKLLDLAHGGKVTVLLDAPAGIVRDPNVHWDGGRILFSYRKDGADDYHLWEINADGSGLRQLTHGWGTSDIDPIYLPNDDILFASTRDPKQCACNVHAQANLFRMRPDGSLIHQLGRNTLFEMQPSLMPDGRVLYTRWEYVDKHFGSAEGLWTMNPDGTGQETYYHNNAWWPGAVLGGKAVPGTNRVIATLGSCHAPPFGEIAVIDRRVGFEGDAPLLKSWPQVPVTRDGYDHVWGLPLRYEDPFPLSDKYFLCSRTISGPEDRYGLYLLDLFGNEVLLHTDDQRGCFDPMPLAPRPRPPVIPDRVDYTQPEGRFFVYDVYRGTGMEGVARGAVKWLRVVESPPKRFISNGDWNNGARQAPAMNWSDVVNKRIIGKVPVEADGSAYFTAPADSFLFFQLLDAEGMMVQSMRSGTMVQAGETVGCVGCHEARSTAGPVRRRPAALARAPSRPQPWYGPPREFNYATEVQPVFDRYCVSCHDFGKPAGRPLNLSGDKTLFFNISYLDLHRKSGVVFTLDPPTAPKPLIKVVNHGPPEVLPAYSWGSHRSKLVDVIRAGHGGMKVDPESLDRVLTWIDLNAVYYGSFACTRPDNPGGRSPLTAAQLARLSQLTGLNVADEIAGSWVNLTRPQLSPCLTLNLPGGSGKPRFSGPDDPAYREALAIIQAGADDLRAHPRMDMPGAVPSEACLRAEEATRRRMAEEAQARRALRAKG